MNSHMKTLDKCEEEEKKNSHREVGLSSSTGKTVPGCEDQLPTG